MASRREIVDFILDKLEGLEGVSARKMFGEYGIYYRGKMVAILADDQLFVKPTPAGKNFWGDCEMAAPYPGAKESMLIPEEDWDDAERLCELIRLSEPEIAAPKARK